MKNLTKLTKAELISKLNGLKQNNNNNNNNNTTFFTKTLEYILLFKSFLLKFTLIALIFKFFKKYSIIRKIFTLINTILFSIFGISMIDIYEIEILSKLINNILEIFSKFHLNILELFGKKVETPSRTAILRGIQSETTGIQTSNENSNGIIERYKKIIQKEEIKEEIPEIQEENTPYYKNKYVIIGGILILSCLTWYFYEDISPIGTSIFAWINRFRPRPDPDSNGFDANIQGNSKFNLSNLKDSVKEKIYGKPKDNGSNSSDSPIGLASPNDGFYELLNKKGKEIDPNEFSKEELERRLKLPIIQEITGERENFDKEVTLISREINSFTRKYENNSFPHEASLQPGIYRYIRERLHKLGTANPEQYENLMQNEEYRSKFDNFVDLENNILGTLPNYIETAQSTNNYEEVEIESRNEQDVWSDKAKSPEPLSPIFIQETAMDAIEKQKSPLEAFWDHLKNKNNKEDITIQPLKIAIDKLFSDDTDITGTEILPEDDNIMGPIQLTDNDLDKKVEELLDETKLFKNELDNIPKVLPEIEVTNNSTPSEMDEFFKTEETKQEIPTIESYNKTEVDHTEVDATASYKIQSEVNITEGIFSKENINNNEVVYSKENIEQRINNNRGLAANLNAIKSRRLEYGSPNVANVGLPRPELSPINLNPDPIISNNFLPNENEGIDIEDNNDNNQESLPLHDWKEEVKFKINRGQSFERFIDMDFGENIRDISKIFIITNDGQTLSINPNKTFSHNTNQSIKWDIKGTSNSYWRELDIYSISIMDKKIKTQTIYTNEDCKFLKEFHDNISKPFK